MKNLITQSETETIKLGKKIANALRGGEVICLYGNLGAGKTTLIKGIALGLGIKKIVTSPTFIIMNLYGIKNQESRLRQPALRRQLRQGEGFGGQAIIRNLVHIDCYRIKNPQDIIDIGAQEYFNEPNCVVVIEWPERIKEVLPERRMGIRIEITGEKKRRFEISNI